MSKLRNMRCMQLALAGILLLLASPCFAAGFPSPELKIDIKRVDPAGKVTPLSAKSLGQWTMSPDLCFQAEVNDPKLKANAETAKVVRSTDVKVQIVDGSIKLCVKNFLSSFSIKPSPESTENLHYLLEVAPSHPPLVIAESCSSEEISVKNDLLGAFWALGMECAPGLNGEVNVMLHANRPKGQGIKLTADGVSYVPGINPVLLPRNDSKVVLELTERKQSFGSLELRAFGPSSPENPNKEKRGKIPLELYAGFTSQSQTVNFSSTSPFNVDNSAIKIQLKAFRRTATGINKDVVKDLFYFAKVRADLGTSGQNIDAFLGLLKPFSVFSRINSFAGLGVEWSQSLKSEYGVSQIVAPGAHLQLESSDLREGARIDFSSLGSKLTKIDAEILFTPPWRFMHGSFLSASYGYFKVPKSPTGAQYDFTETRIGLQVGYRFGASP